ncbi:MAG: membrane protein [Gemmatimonadota bacterium]
MTPRRKIAAAVAATLAFIVVALAALPLLLKGRVEELAHRAVASAVDARVAWGDVGLTFFRDFPDVSLRLDDLSVVGNEPFAGDTLLSVDRFRLVLDAGSLWGAWRGTGPVVVRSVALTGPAVRLVVGADGAANWDIGRGGGGEGEAPGGRAMGLRLRSVEVTGGRLHLDDARTGLVASVEGVDHQLSGDLSRDRVTLRTRTRAAAASVRFAGIPYLSRAAVDLRADVDADLAGGRFTLADNELRLNDLVLRFAGSAAKAGDDVALDVTFSAPETDFARILSLVPVVYARDFASLETSGSFAVEGNVRGTWGEEAFPGFALDARVADGMFRYPDLPLPARDIAFRMAVTNPGGDVDSTVVRVERFHVRLGDQPVEAAFTLRTPVSDPDVDVSVRGAVDLADVGRTVKLPDVEELRGTVRADAAVRARLSDVDAGRWERVAARGTVSARDVAVRAAALKQSVAVEEATLELTPRRAEVRSLRARLGSSDVQATGSLDNVLGFVLRGEVLRGRASFTSGRFVLDEWASDDRQLQLIPVPAGVDLALEGTVGELTFGALQMTDARGSLAVRDERVALDGFSLRTLGGRVSVDGFYETVDPERPAFDVALALDSLDIPSAWKSLLTVRMLAPVAEFARGAFSARLDLAGAFGEGMLPDFGALDGAGSLATTPVVLEGFPALARLSETLSLPQLARPTLNAVRSSLEIRDGRLHVKPFQVRMGDVRMGVSGSNGIDASLDYTLQLAVPRALLGAQADRLVSSLAAQAGRVGVDLQAADTIPVAVGLGGTVKSPTLTTSLGSAVASAGEQARQAVGEAVAQGRAVAEERVDSAAAAARARAQAAADSLMADAEAQAENIRTEARRLADAARAEGNRRAEQVLARATNPVARAAAGPVAERIRQEANTQADNLVAEADRRAEQVLAEARRRADELLRGGG